MKTNDNKEILKVSGQIIDAWQKENTTGNMQHYVKLENDSIYSKWGDLPADMVIGAKVALDYTISGKYKNIVSYIILDSDNVVNDIKPTVKLPSQATLDDITLKDVWNKLLDIEKLLKK